MTTTAQAPASRTARLVGYLFALAAGAVWGTTGPLSTALYRAGEAITGIGFWRLLVGLAGFLGYGLFLPELFRIERRSWLLVRFGWGVPLAPFAGAHPFGDAGVCVCVAVAASGIARVPAGLLA